MRRTDAILVLLSVLCSLIKPFCLVPYERAHRLGIMTDVKSIGHNVTYNIVSRTRRI